MRITFLVCMAVFYASITLAQTTSKTDVSCIKSIEDSKTKEYTSLWRVHKTVSVDGSESYPNDNQFINLYPNQTYELRLNSSVVKGEWFFTFTYEQPEEETTQEEITTILFLIKNDDDSYSYSSSTKLSAYLVQRKTDNGVNYLLLTDLDKLKTYYFIKQG